MKVFSESWESPNKTETIEFALSTCLYVFVDEWQGRGRGQGGDMTVFTSSTSSFMVMSVGGYRYYDEG